MKNLHQRSVLENQPHKGFEHYGEEHPNKPDKQCLSV